MITKGFVNQWKRSSGDYVFFAAQSADEIETRQMARVLGVADETILRQLQTLGFTSRTARLLWLLPSLQVAWADGTSVCAKAKCCCVPRVRARRSLT